MSLCEINSRLLLVFWTIKAYFLKILIPTVSTVHIKTSKSNRGICWPVRKIISSWQTISSSPSILGPSANRQRE